MRAKMVTMRAKMRTSSTMMVTICQDRRLSRAVPLRGARVSSGSRWMTDSSGRQVQVTLDQTRPTEQASWGAEQWQEQEASDQPRPESRQRCLAAVSLQPQVQVSLDTNNKCNLIHIILRC